MPTVVRFAKSTAELSDVLEIRFLALEEAGLQVGHLTRMTRKVIDHFDIFPTTANVIAYRDGKPVASLRALEFQESETLMNMSFDFRESKNPLNGAVYLLDMLAIIERAAAQPAVHRQLLRMILSVLASRRVNHAFFLCPNELRVTSEQLGFKPVADAFFCQHLNREVQPLVIDVTEFYNRLASGIADQELVRFQEAFYFSIFEPGEILAVQGERGTTAFLLESGEVEVLIQGGENLIPVSTIKAGQMIGEVAMVTNEPRTASLIAKTMLSCIAFDRADFVKMMYEQPHKSIDMFKIFSKRLTESNRRIAELQK